VSGAVANTVCTDVAPGSPQFTINLIEGFAKSFKTLAEESGTNGSAAANSGTRFAVTLNNVPANVKVYASLGVTAASPGTGKLFMVTSATADTAAGNLVTPATVTGGPTTGVGQAEPDGIGAVTISSGTGTVYYEMYSVAGGTVESYPVKFYFVSSKGAVAAQTAAITATTSLAPIGAAANKVPNFVNGSSTTTVNGSTYGPCSTYLLFPYVTNASGFETGLAISNTSLDNFGAKGVSSAATQAGTCALNFYGNSDATTNPAAATTASIAGGTVDPFTLTSVAGANFTGYMIANCNFQYAHGFAYIVYNFGTSSGAAMGYVASPFGATGTGARTLAGTVESLGN
jgi:hypothetical protein